MVWNVWARTGLSHSRAAGTDSEGQDSLRSYWDDSGRRGSIVMWHEIRQTSPMEKLNDEVKIMEQVLEMLSDEDDKNDVMAMEKALKILCRNIEK